MNLLKIEKTKILGGSWGSTLAILFAIKYPHRVEKLLLRGLFIATKADWASYDDQSTAAYKKLNSQIPKNYNGGIWKYIYEKLAAGTEADQEKYVRCFAEYNIHKITEGKISTLEHKVDIKELLAVNKVRLHYMVNNFFIEDNYIWNNISMLKNTPITIVHGKYDNICNPSAVIKFSNLLPDTTVIWVEAGHSPKADKIIEAVRAAISNYLKCRY